MSNAPHYHQGAAYCSSCPFYDSMTPEAGACRVDPPNAAVVGMREGLSGGMPQPLVVMVQKQVAATEWCGRHPGRAVLQWDDDKGFDRVPSFDEATLYAVPAEEESEAEPQVE
jgi:hypothetical protein